VLIYLHQHIEKPIGLEALMKHLLIKYISRKDNHVDPNFTYLTYGDSGKRGVQIKKALTPGSFVFFHTSFEDKEYITAFFYVEKILTKDENHVEIDCLKSDSRTDEVIILGNRDRSKILTCPLAFDKQVVENLKSLNINWAKVEAGEQSALKTISDSTRTHRELTHSEIEWLLSECIHRG
jgi:hypothetical protein